MKQLWKLIKINKHLSYYIFSLFSFILLTQLSFIPIKKDLYNHASQETLSHEYFILIPCHCFSDYYMNKGVGLSLLASKSHHPNIMLVLWETSHHDFQDQQTSNHYLKEATNHIDINLRKWSNLYPNNNYLMGQNIRKLHKEIMPPWH